MGHSRLVWIPAAEAAIRAVRAVAAAARACGCIADSAALVALAEAGVSTLAAASMELRSTADVGGNVLLDELVKRLAAAAPDLFE